MKPWLPMIAFLLFAGAGLIVLTHPFPVKGGTCIVFDGPNFMHCKGKFVRGNITYTESWEVKNE
jgi:hypothetical protein